MSKVWREIADPNIHSDFMSTFNEGGVPIEKSRDNLIQKWIYLANVCNFTFQFSSIQQVKECVVYFEKKTHPSTIGDHPPLRGRAGGEGNPITAELAKLLNQTEMLRDIFVAIYF
jgi:hypothetical protein